jgi:hypothetical protein
MRSRSFIAAFAVLFFIPSLASAGRYAGDFLDIGVGGRGLAMGGAFVAFANDGSAAFFNPAGFGDLKKRGVTFMHTWLYSGLASHDFVSAGGPIENGLALGVSMVRLSVDDIPIFPELPGTPDERRSNPDLRPDGVPEGYFQDSEYGACLSVAKSGMVELGKDVGYVSIPVFASIGGNVKYVYQSLMDNTGTGIGVDLGAILAVELNDVIGKSYLGRLSVGANVMDIANTRISWNTPSQREDEIPFNVRYGAGYIQRMSPLRGELTFSYQVDTRYERKSSFGAEYSLMRRLAVRAGYNGNGLTLGAGINGPYGSALDYAFISHQMDNTHRLSFALWF